MSLCLCASLLTSTFSNPSPKKLTYESPPRTRMPREIKITPGTPDSAFSAVSGATGLHTEHQLPKPNNRSMLKSVLPAMNSETEESSLDRSTFSWTSANNKTGKNNVSGSGGSSDKKEKLGSGRSSMGGFMIGDSSRSIFSDDSDAVPSKKLFAKTSPKKGKSS